MLLIEKLKNIEVVELTEVVEPPIKAEGVIVGAQHQHQSQDFLTMM